MCLRQTWLVLLLMAIGPASVHAHHSWARYDGDQLIEITGTITKVEWASPHVIFRFTVDENGESAEWTAEMDPPVLLHRYGIRHDAVTPGLTVKLTGVPARSGARMMRALTVELPDGTKYRLSGRV